MGNTFKSWLSNGKKEKEGWASSVSSRINRIAQVYDLEYEFKKDRYESLLELFEYRNKDIKAGKTPKAEIIVNGSYVDVFSDLRKALRKHREYLDELNMSALIESVKYGDCVYKGNLAGFNKYVGPICRNTIQNITKAPKKRVLKCECCGEKTILEAAHLNGKERPMIIKEILESYYQPVKGQDYYEVNLPEFEIRFKYYHEPIEEKFYFLCKKCHNVYDGKEQKGHLIKTKEEVETIVNKNRKGRNF